MENEQKSSVLDLVEPAVVVGPTQPWVLREWKFRNGAGEQLLERIDRSPDAAEPFLDLLLGNLGGMGEYAGKQSNIVWISDGLCLESTEDDSLDPSFSHLLCWWRVKIELDASNSDESNADESNYSEYYWNVYGSLRERDSLRVFRFLHKVIAFSGRIRATTVIFGFDTRVEGASAWIPADEPGETSDEGESFDDEDDSFDDSGDSFDDEGESFDDEGDSFDDEHESIDDEHESFDASFDDKAGCFDDEDESVDVKDDGDGGGCDDGDDIDDDDDDDDDDAFDENVDDDDDDDVEIVGDGFYDGGVVIQGLLVDFLPSFGDEVVMALRDLVSLPRSRREVEFINALWPELEHAVVVQCSPVVKLVVDVVNWRNFGEVLAEAMLANQCPARLELRSTGCAPGNDVVLALERTTCIEELTVVVEKDIGIEPIFPAVGQNRGIRDLVARQTGPITSDLVKSFWVSIMNSTTIRSVDASKIVGVRGGARPVAADRTLRPFHFEDLRHRRRVHDGSRLDDVAEGRECAELVAELIRTNPRITSLTYSHFVHDAQIMESRVMPIVCRNRLKSLVSALPDASTAGGRVARERSVSALIGSLSPVERIRPEMLFFLLRSNVVEPRTAEELEATGESEAPEAAEADVEHEDSDVSRSNTTGGSPKRRRIGR